MPHRKTGVIMMAQPMLNKTDPQPEKREAVVIKKYANRRLYNTETSTYVTLEDLAQMVRGDRDFVVYDAKSGDDLTHAVLTQIIVEQENREGGQTLLPDPFPAPAHPLLRRQHRHAWCRATCSSASRTSSRSRRSSARSSPTAFSNPAAAFEAYQEQARKNMAMFEQAMSMWTSFGNAKARAEAAGRNGCCGEGR